MTAKNILCYFIFSILILFLVLNLYKTHASNSQDKKLVDYLIKQNLSISCAESLTGGYLTARFVDFPGVSKILQEGVVAYSNNAKIKRLGVNPESLEKFGAVSSQVAIEMLKNFETDIGIATTGFASKTSDHEAGLVYIGIKIKNNIYAQKFNFTGSRLEIRKKTVQAAFEILRKELLED